MFCPHKNSYLQMQCKINPRVINRSVDRAMHMETPLNCKDPPLLRLCSEQPLFPIQNCDVTRRPLAFGRWALPKLKKEIFHSDLKTKLQAICSLCDLIHDPEKMYEAIRLDIIKRLIRLLEIYPKGQIEELRERVLLALQTFASHAMGREAMLYDKKLQFELKRLVLPTNSENIRCKAAAVIRELTNYFIACIELSEAGFVSLLIRRAVDETDKIKLMHLESLELLLMDRDAQEIAFDYNGVERFVQMLDSENKEIKSQAARCLMMLMTHKIGKDLAVEMELLNKLNELLHDDDREVYTTAAAVIMFATITVRAKHQAAVTHMMPQKLAKLTNDFNSPPTQMFSIKALGNICEHPSMRKMFKDYYLEKMKKIVVSTYKTGAEELTYCRGISRLRPAKQELEEEEGGELARYKQILIDIIEWQPWLHG